MKRLSTTFYQRFKSQQSSYTAAQDLVSKVAGQNFTYIPLETHHIYHGALSHAFTPKLKWYSPSQHSSTITTGLVGHSHFGLTSKSLATGNSVFNIQYTNFFNSLNFKVGIVNFAKKWFSSTSQPSGGSTSPDNDSGQGILVGTSSFKKLLLESTVIIDKSLLIKEFLEGQAVVILNTFPRRCGKSINLDMIKTFLEIEVDENGIPLEANKIKNAKLFFGNKKALKPLKISTEKITIIEECEKIQHLPSDYQGKFPVVYIDFKATKGENYQQIETRVKGALHKSFKEHKYLLKSKKLASDEINKLENYISETKYESITLEEIRVGLNFLSEMLYKHFNKKVYVLVDEYDAPINYGFKKLDEKEFEQVIGLFRAINEAVFKTDANDSEYLAKGFITGILRIAKADLFSGLNNLVEHNALSENYAQYYAFTQDEVNYLLDKYNVPKNLADDIKDWYNGYKVGDFHVYNIWSIVNCLKNFQDYRHKGDIEQLKRLSIKNYWERSGDIDFIEDLFKHQEIEKRVQELINSKAITVNLGDLKISSKDFQTLKSSMTIGGNFKINDQFYDLFFSYLFLTGYLTLDTHVSGNVYTLKLPNKEITAELNNKLLVYYKQQYTVDPKLFTNVTDALVEVFNKQDIKKKIDEFEKSFKELLLALPQFTNIKNNEGHGFHGNEDIVHSVLNYIALQIKTLSHFGTEIWYKNQARADIMLVDSATKQAIIIELKYNQHVDIASEQLEKYSNLLENFKNIKNVIYVAVNISEDKQITTKFTIARNTYYNVPGRGATENSEDDNQTLPFHEKFSEYYSKDMEKILALRIKQLDEDAQNTVKLVSSKYQLGQDTDSDCIINELINLNLKECQLALVPYNIDSKHWVGLVFAKVGQEFKMVYLDPENKPISITLDKDLDKVCSNNGYSILIEQKKVQQQKFNNCGPEVIEDFIDYLSGERISQEDTVPYHSKLLENELLAEGVQVLGIVYS